MLTKAEKQSLKRAYQRVYQYWRENHADSLKRKLVRASLEYWLARKKTSVNETKQAQAFQYLWDTIHIGGDIE